MSITMTPRAAIRPNFIKVGFMADGSNACKCHVELGKESENCGDDDESPLFKAAIHHNHGEAHSKCSDGESSCSFPCLVNMNYF